ncbi:hypothetical protein [Actinomyces faecalis]|uniref:hypothetical protein n=1 Tax=Actinomyces faecalis TaxID=2722820 RepID=UPI00155259EE|nr:hypothetical protein [Actinomyces faecalis]
MSPVSRRALARGAAWSVPAVAFAAAAPATALSCPPSVRDDVEAVFKAHKSRLPSMEGVDLVFSFHSAGHLNGAGGENSLHLVNRGTVGVDASTFPLRIDFGFKHVDTSPAVNTTFKDAQISGPIAANREAINVPWNPAGNNTTEPADAAFVGQCSSDLKAVERRDLSFGSSYLDVRNPVTGELLREKGFAELGEEFATCMPDSGGAYGYALVFRRTVMPDERVNVLAYRLRDGSASGTGTGRIYVASGMRVRGYYPPSWEELVSAVTWKYPNLSEEDVAGCYRQAYDARAEQWYASGESLAGAKVSIAGWSRFFDPDADVAGWTHPTDGNMWTWSHEVGSFMSGGDEARQDRITSVAQWSPTLVKTSSKTQSVTELRHRDGII